MTVAELALMGALGALIVASLLAYRRTQIRSALYFGIGGLGIGVAGAAHAVASPAWATYVLGGVGAFVFGWGFARFLTVDSGVWRRHRGLIRFGLLRGKGRLRANSSQEPALPSRRMGFVFGLVLLTYAGAIAWVWPARRVSVLTFGLWGLQVLVAAIMYLRDDRSGIRDGGERAGDQEAPGGFSR